MSKAGSDPTIADEERGFQFLDNSEFVLMTFWVAVGTVTTQSTSCGPFSRVYAMPVCFIFNDICWVTMMSAGILKFRHKLFQLHLGDELTCESSSCETTAPFLGT